MNILGLQVQNLGRVSRAQWLHSESEVQSFAQTRRPLSAGQCMAIALQEQTTCSVFGNPCGARTPNLSPNATFGKSSHAGHVPPSLGRDDRDSEPDLPRGEDAKPSPNMILGQRLVDRHLGPPQECLGDTLRRQDVRRPGGCRDWSLIASKWLFLQIRGLFLVCPYSALLFWGLHSGPSCLKGPK